MKKENKVVGFLVPVVAVIVLIESVILISNLSSNKSTTVVSTTPTGQQVTTEVGKESQSAIYAVSVTASAAGEMKLNQVKTVEVKAVGNADKSLDSVSVYLKYDPTAFEVSNLSYDKKLPAPNFAKASQTTGLVVANYLISAPAGLKVASGEELSLIKFNVKPIKTGDFSFEISTGTEMKEAATMFVENATGKILPFTANKLMVNVSR